MRITLLIILAFIFTDTRSQSLRFEWVKQFGGTSLDGGTDIVLDASGNIYSTGFFTGTVDFDPGPGVFNLVAPPTNEEDIFISKLDPNGNFIWAKQISGNFFDNAYSLKVDAAGNVYITGVFFSNTDFDPGPGEYRLQSSGNEDAFVAKLDAGGNFMWAKKFGASSFDRGNALSLDPQGNVVITGFFKETVDFDPGPNVFNLVAQDDGDIFILKLTANGGFVWAKQIAGTGFQGGYGVSVSATGNVYATGYFAGTVDFDPGPAVFNITGPGMLNEFVVKLDAAGNFKWAKVMGGNKDMYSYALALDAAENVYTTGSFDGQVDMDPGPASLIFTATGAEDAFVSKLDSNGNLIWARQIGGNTYESGLTVTTDVDGNCYVGGFFQDMVDFDPGPGVFNISSNGFSDSYILKLDAAGNFVLATGIGGDLFERIVSLKLDANKTIYAIGYFENTVDFNPGTPVVNLTSVGKTDIFILKLRQCDAITTTDVNATTCNNYTLNGQVYTSSGIYTQTLQNATGCDSIITLHLVITRASTQSDVTICEGEQYFAGGAFRTTTGTYADTLLTALGCDSLLVTNLTVLPSLKPMLGSDRDLCTGEVLRLYPGNFARYLWNNGSTDSSINVNTPGLYTVRVTANNSCTAIDSFTIRKINPLPTNFLPPDTLLCTSAILPLQVNGFSNYTWSTGAASPSVTITGPGVYSLVVTDKNNCVGSDSIVVRPKEGCIPIAIPNSFTPNNDGLNDIFRPMVNTAVSEFRMQIFDRWGQLIFRSNSLLNGWDGTNKGSMLPMGAYTYFIEIKNAAGELSRHKGTILLLR